MACFVQQDLRFSQLRGTIDSRRPGVLDGVRAPPSRIGVTYQTPHGDCLTIARHIRTGNGASPEMPPEKHMPRLGVRMVQVVRLVAL